MDSKQVRVTYRLTVTFKGNPSRHEVRERMEDMLKAGGIDAGNDPFVQVMQVDPIPEKGDGN